MAEKIKPNFRTRTEGRVVALLDEDGDLEIITKKPSSDDADSFKRKFTIEVGSMRSSPENVVVAREGICADETPVRREGISRIGLSLDLYVLGVVEAGLSKKEHDSRVKEYAGKFAKDFADELGIPYEAI